METKICNKCGKELPISEFGLNPMSKGGHINYCKRCVSKNPPPEFIICSICGQIKPYYEFSIASKSRYGRMWTCKKCVSAHTFNELRNLRDSIDSEYRNKRCIQRNESKRRNFIHNMWKAAKKRAENKGLEFNIEESDIIIPKVCPILEVPFIYSTKGDYKYTPSLDRIDNTKGYIKGNIQVISSLANTMKNAASKEELQKFCTNILRYSLNTIEKEDSEQEDKEPLG